MKEKDTSIRELFHQPPTETLTDVSVSGWVRTVRDSKAFGFIELNDGTYFKNLQIVLEDGKTADFANALKVTLGSAIRAKGDLVPTPGMKQPFELKAKEIEVVGLCSPDYPLQKKRHSFEYLRTIAHLRPRTNTFNAVFRVRSVAAYSFSFCSASMGRSLLSVLVRLLRGSGRWPLPCRPASQSRAPRLRRCPSGRRRGRSACCRCPRRCRRRLQAPRPWWRRR